MSQDTFSVVDAESGKPVNVGDLANQAARVNVVAGGTGGGTVTQGPPGASPWPVTAVPERSTAGAPVGVAVGVSAVLLLSANAARKQICITNNGTSNIYVGASSAVTATGATMGSKLVPNGALTDSGDDCYTGDYYAVGDAASGSQNVSVWERT